MVYQLDYNPDGLLTKNNMSRCLRTAGWEYIQDYFGYSYFRKPASEMAEMKRSSAMANPDWRWLKRFFFTRMVPLIVIFLFAGYSNLYTQDHGSFLSRVCAELGLLDTVCSVSFYFSGTWPPVLEILEKPEQIVFCSV